MAALSATGRSCARPQTSFERLTSRFQRGTANRRNWRISPTPARPGDGLLSDHIAGVRPVRRERVFMPRRRPLPEPRGSLGGGGKQSFDRAVSFLNPGRSAIALALPSGAQSRPEKRCRIILCRLQDAMPPQRLPRCVRGRRIVNSVNSPGALLTAIVPPCCWVTMS